GRSATRACWRSSWRASTPRPPTARWAPTSAGATTAPPSPPRRRCAAGAPSANWDGRRCGGDSSALHPRRIFVHPPDAPRLAGTVRTSPPSPSRRGAEGGAVVRPALLPASLVLFAAALPLRAADDPA